MAPVRRRSLIRSIAVAGAATELALVTSACAKAEPVVPKDDASTVSEFEPAAKNPHEFGAVGDGEHDDTSAVQAAYEAAAAEGGVVEFTDGEYSIPGNLEVLEPISIRGRGRKVTITGGEVIFGPSGYDSDRGGVDFSGTKISGITFSRRDDYGKNRCLVLRNVRGLDVIGNTFSSAGKGIAVEAVDGNNKFHTTAMIRISQNRFDRLRFGIYADSDRWDRYSDWQVIDNYFNFCSDTSVWIDSSADGALGGVDGLTFTGNVLFSQNYSRYEEPLFVEKRYNLRVGKSNWICISDNNFFEAGLSAVYLSNAQHFTFVGNNVAWPGQRELADCLEIHDGSPVGTIQGNTFAQWTRAAVGLYNLDDFSRIEVGQNGWRWDPNPPSWTGQGDLPGYRVLAEGEGGGFPSIRDFQPTGAFDEVKGSAQIQSRDVKSAKSGVSGSSRRSSRVEGPESVFRIADITGARTFGGLITVSAFNSQDESLMATYLLFVSSHGSKCTVIESGGYTDGAEESHPSFTWTLSGPDLVATPVGKANGVYHFDALAIGAVASL
ncbi:hypothetical protein MMUR_55430 [Mycolicibacterium murale]|uniref:Rhamnogalacturonase A/B/Epimerase-like pectate lyase domain-containing protein n=1 Tax=Mycolicibacterium murale TaxID=182220 RepID=A0A7I9WW15_9MYCO|nr:glycosyl hydrolase family 28-related protein [Mycolicibacterium murale]MCV7185730.1 hypothetical protein [Mycolicibacterium murale]GFG61407.1 hypothetical protein MMUR_55430 [Mycolicibacterium murale]